MLLIKTILVICAIIVNISGSENIDIQCSHAAEFFTVPHSQCASYYRCHANRIDRFECPYGTVFDFSKQNCVGSLKTCFEPTCQGKHNGSHADETQGCRRFFRCSSENLIGFGNCPSGFLFNGEKCDYEHRVTCEIPKKIVRRTACNPSEECRNLPEGLHPDESSKDCKSYIKCFKGKSTKHRCPSTSVYHPLEKNCVPDTLYDCPRSDSWSASICKRKTDGFHLDPRFGCRHFVKCSHGIAVQFDECDAGQIFDSHKKSCTFTPSTRCSHDSYSVECLSLETGFYQNRSLESSCRDFFHCYNGRKTTLGCRVGEVFNGETCVDERHYSCPNLDPDSCDTKENGYYRDNNLDCRSYFYCSSHRKYSLLCKDGQAFDGNKCVSKRHVEPCSKNLDCMGKYDGYYQDLKSGCAKYYYCKQGDKVQILTCRYGRLFNGNSCVSPASYSCPGTVGFNQALKLNCVQRKCQPTCSRDGFFADYDSRCRNYFFCVSGKPTKLSCQGNQVFDENVGLCVPQEKYQCPVYCSQECS